MVLEAVAREADPVEVVREAVVQEVAAALAVEAEVLVEAVEVVDAAAEAVAEASEAVASATSAISSPINPTVRSSGPVETLH